MATIKEIADKLNLSTATVSRTLNNDLTLSIKPETRNLILSTAKKMGYVGKTRKKKRKKEKTVLIIHKHTTFRSQIDSSYYYTMRTGIEDVFGKSKINYVFKEINRLDEKKLDVNGILLVGNYSAEQFDTISAIIGDIPAVVIGTVIFHKNRFNRVSFSNYESVMLALNYLYGKGHREIGYLGITEIQGTGAFHSRKETFINFMEEHNLYHSEWLIESNHGKDRVERGYEMTQKLLSLPKLPTAIFCANDSVAIGVIKCLIENNIRVPEDMSVISHDGAYPTQYSIPPITTINVHPYQLGVEASKLLIQRMEESVEYCCELLLTPTLIERESVFELK